MVYFCFSSFAYSQTISGNEYEIKSSFLFNFSKFITWPPESFKTAEAPFVIGIFGDDPFGQYLDNIAAGEVVDNHPVIIHHYQSLSEIDECHILYLNTSVPMVKDILLYIHNRSVLTVSDLPDFTGMGGMVAFSTVDNEVKLQINVGQTKNANLVVSSKLLRLADITN